MRSSRLNLAVNISVFCFLLVPAAPDERALKAAPAGLRILSYRVATPFYYQALTNVQWSRPNRSS
jgi:hypothetical protein